MSNFKPDIFEERPDYIKPNLATDFLSPQELRMAGEEPPLNRSHLSTEKQQEIIQKVRDNPKLTNVAQELIPEYAAIIYLLHESQLFDGYNPGGNPMLLPEGLPLAEENLVDLSEHSTRDHDMNQTHKYGSDFCKGIRSVCEDLEKLLEEAQISLPHSQGLVIHKTYLNRHFSARMNIWKDKMQNQMRKLYKRDSIPGDGYTLRDTVRVVATNDAFDYATNLFPEVRDLFNLRESFGVLPAEK